MNFTSPSYFYHIFIKIKASLFTIHRIFGYFLLYLALLFIYPAHPTIHPICSIQLLIPCIALFHISTYPHKYGTNIYLFTLQRFGPSPSPNFISTYPHYISTYPHYISTYPHVRHVHMSKSTFVRNVSFI